MCRWIITSNFHVIPLDDYRDHIDDENCWCRPKEPDLNGVWMHNAMDQHESYEQGLLQ
jgi:hypothetical protein